MLTGEIIKEAIRKSGISMDAAATMIGVSRQTLYNNLNRAVLKSDFINSVNEAFGNYFILNSQGVKFKKSTATNDTYESFVLNDPDLITYDRVKDLTAQIEYYKRMIDMQDNLIKRLEEDLERYHARPKSKAM